MRESSDEPHPAGYQSTGMILGNCRSRSSPKKSLEDHMKFEGGYLVDPIYRIFI